MLTRCPKCATTFRVTTEQLKARQGRVRCGACQEVFSALDTLIEVARPAVSASVIPETEPQAAAQVVPDEIAEPAVEPQALAPKEVVATTVATSDVEPTVAPEPITAEEAESEPEPTTTELQEALSEPIVASAFADIEVQIFEPVPAAIAEPKIAPAPVVMAEPVAEAAPETESDPTELSPAAPVPELEPLLHEESPQQRWPWMVGIVLATLVFAAQIAIRFRTEIVVIYPDARPVFTSLCATLGCELALPRKPELVGIEASDLHPDSGGRLILIATLKNRAPFAQEYPHLELTLTDTSDQPLVRRVISANEYLLPKAPDLTGFGANSELAINLAIDAPGISAAGYRLYLFYP